MVNMGLIRSIKNIQKYDPSARHTLDILLTSTGLHAIWLYRIAHLFWVIRLKLIARMLMNVTRFLTGIEIHPAAQIGKGFVIDHGMGVVIGESTRIGDDVLIYQGVTLGGTGNISDTKRHPTICSHVMIGAGAKILGDIKVGPGARVGANAVVLKNVPDGATAIGIPARFIEKEGITPQECSLTIKDA